MLLNFRVANHRSIRDEQSLQLNPVYEADRPPGTHWEAVPVVGIFGANAAGKSNVIDALAYMTRMVVSSHRDAEPDGGVARQPFRLEEAARGEPSWYVVDLLIDGIRYTYGFSVDDDRVVDEWLHSFPHGRKRKIFERSVDGLEIGDSQHRRELELVENITEPNVLFMSLAARSRQDDFRPVYDWFARSLQFSRRMQGPGRIGTARILENPDQHPEFIALLRAADLGIAECGTERVLLDEEELRKRYGTRIPPWRLEELEEHGPREVMRPWIGHRGRDGIVRMDVSEESEGTQALLRQAPLFMGALRRGGTFVVDEIDSSLHPILTARLIGLFQDSATNPNGAQLIFTSHDASLLGRTDGEDVLRRDQVWFVEKNEHGETELFALADFKPRQEENRERRYLSGSYGGVPYIDDDFASAIAARGDDDGKGGEAERTQASLF
ncbi:ATP-binding protein [Kitasatospora xanthocidica]|uniref:ATP-binding protein n=1 Tax=Kitasatospora xanthocidica TaxID=83382 RepID=A0A373A190_9ACTN|nr:ATP-binding protein [Kitasatospora xanthocidica]RGD61442.1 ATP-binding protein [Kitasatospora xanthocidica]